MSFLQQGFKICPQADYSQRDIHLVYTLGISRGQMASFLYKASREGGHVDLEFVKHDSVKGFVLKPDTISGRRERGKIVHDFCIDGEIVQIEEGEEIMLKPLGEELQMFVV